MKGEVYRARFDGRGYEQRGARFAVVLQSDSFPWLSTWIVAPTTGSDSAAEAIFRPEVTIEGVTGRVLMEQMRVIDPRRLGALVGEVAQSEQQAMDEALRALFDLSS